MSQAKTTEDDGGAGSATSGELTDIDLKLDDQVNKFLEHRHKLTYFLITAAVVTIGFTLNAVIGSNLIGEPALLRFGVLVTGCMLGLLSVAAALGSLYSEIASFQMHLKYRHQRKSWSEVPLKDQNAWTTLNRRARDMAGGAFALLLASVATQVLYFAVALYPHHREADMHHYGEDSLEVVSSAAGHQFTFTNKESRARIVMQIPRSGAKEGDQDLTDDEAQRLAAEIAHLLRRELR
jgi:hypothetical protein